MARPTLRFEFQMMKINLNTMLIIIGENIYQSTNCHQQDRSIIMQCRNELHKLFVLSKYKDKQTSNLLSLHLESRRLILWHAMLSYYTVLLFLSVFGTFYLKLQEETKGLFVHVVRLSRGDTSAHAVYLVI